MHATNKGHIVRVCRSKPGRGRKPRGTHYLQEEEETSEDVTYSLFTVRDQGVAPIFKVVNINDVPITMEVDTGAAVSVVTEATYQRIKESSQTQPLQHSQVCLKIYTGETIPVLGQLPVKVSCGENEHTLAVLVVKGGGPYLMGRNWLRVLQVTLGGVHSLEVE